MDVHGIASAIIKAVRGLTNQSVGLHEPTFVGREWEYVKSCLDTGWVSSAGPFVQRFEEEIASFTGSKHAIATVNGTSALHISLLLSDVGADDEVLLPSLTFVATANAVRYTQATPHFVDCDANTFGVDSQRLNEYLLEITKMQNGRCVNKRTGRTIKAIVPMHTFGHPVDMEPLLEVAERFGLHVIEDAAESLGSYYKGKHTGTLGRMGVVSFNGNKIITTGGGGVILTDNPLLAQQAKHLSSTAKLPHQWAFQHDHVGYNYRMPNLNAALGCAQLESIENFIAIKRELAQYYEEAFKEVDGVRFLKEPSYAESNYWLNTLVLDKGDHKLLSIVLDQTNGLQIATRPCWMPMHQLPIYENCPRMDLTVTEDLANRIINLPSSVSLMEG